MSTDDGLARLAAAFVTAGQGHRDRNAAPFYEDDRAQHRTTLPSSAEGDTLLPKLISGELRVRDAARFIGREA